MEIKAITADVSPGTSFLLVDPLDYDRRIALTAAERAAMHLLSALSATQVRTPAAVAALHTLERFERPLAAIRALWKEEMPGLQRLRKLLYGESLRLDRAWWGWPQATWSTLLQGSLAAFVAAAPSVESTTASYCRRMLLMVAYLFSDMREPALVGMTADYCDRAFGNEHLNAATAVIVGALAGRDGAGYANTESFHSLIRRALAHLFLRNRSPLLSQLTGEMIRAMVDADDTSGYRSEMRAIFRLVGVALGRLGYFTWEEDVYTRPDVEAEAELNERVPPLWAAWCWAWYRRNTGLSQVNRRAMLGDILAVGRWLAVAQPQCRVPADWDEDLALTYTSYLCNDARLGDDAVARGRRALEARHTLGKPFAPRTIHARLSSLRYVFSEWQDRPHAVGDALAERIPLRFNAKHAFATPRAVRNLIQPDPGISRWQSGISSPMRPPHSPRSTSSACTAPSRTCARWRCSGSPRRVARTRSRGYVWAVSAGTGILRC